MEVFLLVVAAWVFSVCLHEFGHAFVAYRGGDYTVVEKGYLTLNPIRYTHPVYSLVMPVIFLLLGGIGLPGGAVYINDHLIRSRGWRTACSLAGPAMNLGLTVVLCIPFWVHLIDQNGESPLGSALALLVQLQLSAVLFNLIPIPPLDGFQALSPWLPPEVAGRIHSNSNILFWILIIVMWRVPEANNTFWWLVRSGSDLLGIDGELAHIGWWRFFFWKHT